MQNNRFPQLHVQTVESYGTSYKYWSAICFSLLSERLGSNVIGHKLLKFLQ